MGADKKVSQAGYVCRQADLGEAFATFQEGYFELAESHEHVKGWASGLSRQLELARHELSLRETERTRAEARLDDILQALPAGVLILDAEGQVREFNAVAASMLTGVDAGCLWRDIVSASFAPRWDDGHDITLKNGRRVNLSTQALQGEPGQIVLITDVTETRGLQDELSRHRRLASMGEMAAALAHQIRTPLASAILYLSNVRLGRGDEALRGKCVDQAFDRLQHLERLVADMLLFARGGAFDATEVSLADLLQDLSAEGPNASEFHVDLIDAAPGTTVRGNRDALASALGNLVDNARQACNGNGSMCIEAVMEGAATLALRFTDDGPGVPGDLRETIFEPFFTTRMGGSGLGLAVTQAVVRAHGGEISLEDAGGQGSAFVVRLPAQQRAA